MVDRTLAARTAHGPANWRRLAEAAFWANVPILSLLLMVGLPKQALSVASGMCVGLLSYGLLYRDLVRAVRHLHRGGRAYAQGNLAWAQSGRFLLLAACLFLLFEFVPIFIPCLLLGYLVTQIAVSVTVLRFGLPSGEC